MILAGVSVLKELAAESVLVGERYVCKVASLDFCRKVCDRDFQQVYSSFVNTMSLIEVCYRSMN